jgi:tRNA(fMet)-specific endonuclease VapC
MYLLDTDMVSYFMRNNPKKVRIEVTKHEKDALCISTISYAELIFGLKKNYSKQLDFWLNEVLSKFQIFPFDEAAALAYGDIRVKLEKSGTPLDNMDMLIAACALSHKATLVSHNRKHFSIIKGLKIEDWS